MRMILNELNIGSFLRPKEAGDEGATAYKPISEFELNDNYGYDPNRLVTSADLTSQGESLNSLQEFEFERRLFTPLKGLHWKTTVDGLKRLAEAKRIFLVGNTLRYLRFIEDFPVFPNRKYMD